MPKRIWFLMVVLIFFVSFVNAPTGSGDSGTACSCVSICATNRYNESTQNASLTRTVPLGVNVSMTDAALVQVHATFAGTVQEHRLAVKPLHAELLAAAGKFAMVRR